jgi:hypothetical protein
VGLGYRRNLRYRFYASPVEYHDPLPDYSADDVNAVMRLVLIKLQSIGRPRFRPNKKPMSLHSVQSSAMHPHFWALQT